MNVSKISAAAMLGTEPSPPAKDRGKLLLKIGGDKPFELFEADLGAAAKKEVAKAEKAARGAEEMFMKQLADKMMPKDIGGKGQMGDFIHDQLTQSIASMGAKSNSLGIAKMFKHQMTDSIYRQEAARIILGDREAKPKQETKA